MKRRKLKHYTTYLAKLELLAESMGLTVIYTLVDTDGVYIPTRNEIRIDSSLFHTTTIAVFLHEIGHFLDVQLVEPGTFTFNPSTYHAYEAFNRGRATKKQKVLVLDAEVRAWNLGRALAKTLKINLGKWFDTTQADCLKTYK